MGTEFGIVILFGVTAGLTTYLLHLYRQLAGMRLVVGKMALDLAARDRNLIDLVSLISACILKTHTVEKAVGILATTAKTHETAIVGVQAALEADMN